MQEASARLQEHTTSQLAIVLELVLSPVDLQPVRDLWAPSVWEGGVPHRHDGHQQAILQGTQLLYCLGFHQVPNWLHNKLLVQKPAWHGCNGRSRAEASEGAHYDYVFRRVRCVGGS